MKLTDFMQNALILLDLEAKDRDEALRRLVKAAADNAAVRDPEAFLAEVITRESLGSTAVGNGVAFPHARSASVGQIVVVLGRLKKGVDFGAEDGEKVRLVVLMGTPPQEIARYLKVLARFAALLRQEEVRSRLLHATSPAEVLRIIDQFDSAAQEP
ncbi:MAG: PTS sugar transporter subunit IIA [candidate division KSB1 bacterium]|nr:PTS sugar transporter subunit IIA [candidate division KSB1 bacterium]